MKHTTEHKRLKGQEQEINLYFITGFPIPKTMSADSNHATNLFVDQLAYFIESIKFS